MSKTTGSLAIKCAALQQEVNTLTAEIERLMGRLLDAEQGHCKCGGRCGRGPVAIHGAVYRGSKSGSKK